MGNISIWFVTGGGGGLVYFFALRGLEVTTPPLGWAYLITTKVRSPVEATMYLSASVNIRSLWGSSHFPKIKKLLKMHRKVKELRPTQTGRDSATRPSSFPGLLSCLRCRKRRQTRSPGNEDATRREFSVIKNK